MTVLLLNAAAVWAMTGLIWFVQVVHYPLFAHVGAGAWPGYHARHSRSTTWVVVGPMVADLATSAWLVADRPDGVGATAAVAGLGLAVLTWAVTGLGAVPVHERLGRHHDSGLIRRLVRVNGIRTAAWTAHAVLVAAMLAAAA